MDTEELFTRCEECFGVVGVACEALRAAGRASLAALEAQKLDPDLWADTEGRVLDQTSDTILGLGCRLGKETLKLQLLGEPDP